MIVDMPLRSNNRCDEFNIADDILDDRRPNENVSDDSDAKDNDLDNAKDENGLENISVAILIEEMLQIDFEGFLAFLAFPSFFNVFLSPFFMLIFSFFF